MNFENSNSIDIEPSTRVWKSIFMQLCVFQEKCVFLQPHF